MRYLIRVQWRETADVVVEADSYEEAEQSAIDMVDAGEGRTVNRDDIEIIRGLYAVDGVL